MNEKNKDKSVVNSETENDQTAVWVTRSFHIFNRSTFNIDSIKCGQEDRSQYQRMRLIIEEFYGLLSPEIRRFVRSAVRSAVRSDTLSIVHNRVGCEFCFNFLLFYNFFWFIINKWNRNNNSKNSIISHFHWWCNKIVFGYRRRRRQAIVHIQSESSEICFRWSKQYWGCWISLVSDWIQTLASVDDRRPPHSIVQKERSRFID